MEIPLKTKLPYDPAIPLLGINPKKTTIQKTCTPLEKEMATHSSILAWRIPDRGAWQATVPWGHEEWDMTEPTEEAHSLCYM